jgi:hypothetical protein
MRSYIVAYTTRDNKDTYVVFHEEDALVRALDLYNKLTDEPNTYCANVCEIVATTEHYATGTGSCRDNNQYFMSQELVEVAGINVVRCGQCAEVMLHRVGDEVLRCPHCSYESDPCDFPDLFQFDRKGGRS